MSKEQLDEREFELINYIGLDMPLTQRDLSRQLNLSLGAVNMLIKKLITKGYIKVVNLNKNKFQYLLTPQGFSEKMRKSINYTLKTINSIGLIKNRVRDLLEECRNQGERTFYMIGNPDLTNIVKMAFQESKFDDCTLSVITELPINGNKGVVLVCQDDDEHSSMKDGLKRIDLIEELARNHLFVGKS